MKALKLLPFLLVVLCLLGCTSSGTTSTLGPNYIESTGYTGEFEHEFNVSPVGNPYFNVNYFAQKGEILIKITDDSGEVIYQGNQNSENTGPLKVRAPKSGVYRLSVKEKDFTGWFHLSCELDED